MDEGYIKFDCNWIEDEPIPTDELYEINRWRDKLYAKKLVGAYNNEIGFGNISIKSGRKGFIITGSTTGNFPKLDENHYVLVDQYNFAENSLTCRGPIEASSESLTHAAVYESSSDINAVIHVHDLGMWEELIDKVPTTNRKVPYGTPGMAYEIKRLFREANASERKIVVMGGHKEGIISFGRNLDEAGDILLSELERLIQVPKIL